MSAFREATLPPMSMNAILSEKARAMDSYIQYSEYVIPTVSPELLSHCGSCKKSMTCCDSKYWDYIDLSNKTSFPLSVNVLNDKYIFSKMTEYNTNSERKFPCFTPYDFSSFFAENKKSLFVGCHLNGSFSFCQEYYLFQYNATSHWCQRFRRQPYSRSHLFTDVTLTTQFSLDRFDRVPYILRRWKGPISFAIFVTEKEVASLAKHLFSLKSKIPAVFTIYVQKDIAHNTPYYVHPTGNETKLYPQGIYPINLLRDLSIESISTTHYLVIDIDVFVSTTLYENLRDYRMYLVNDNSVVLVPLFTYNETLVEPCIQLNDCEEIWKHIPKDKNQLLKQLRKNRVGVFGNYHDIANVTLWANFSSNSLLVSPFFSNMEPYGVFRRSVYNPFFHPLFFNYGGDKMEFFHRLHMIGRSHLYVVSMDFGFNVPHKASRMAVEYKLDKLEDPMFIQYGLFIRLFNEWKKGRALYKQKQRAS